MTPLPKPVKVTATIVLVAWLAAVVLVLRGYLWPVLCSVEESVLQAMVDPQLFTRDYAVQEWLRFNPRSYYFYLIFGFTKLGLSLPAAAVLLHAGALALLLTGLFALGRSFALGSAAIALLLLWFLLVSAGTIGGVFLYTHAALPAVWVMGAVVWGFVFAHRGRWVAAYACFGAASVLQFLVGLYAGALLLPALPWRQGRVVAAALGVWILSLLINYGPLLALGSMGTRLLDGHTFVEIYAQLRCPNHLVPSTWEWPVWLQFFSFYAGALLCLRELRDVRSPGERRFFFAVLGAAAAGLVFNYLFVELWPWVIAAKTQPARLTPFAEFAVFLALALVAQHRIARRDYGAAILLALAPLTPFPGFFLIAFALFLPPTSTPRPLWRWGAFALLLLFAYGYLGTMTSRLALHYVGRLMIFGAAFLVDRFGRAPTVRGLLTAGGVAALSVAAWFLLPAGASRALASRFAVDTGPVDAPGILGARFGAATPKDALVLVPPEGDSWSFRLFARRAVVIQTKDLPFTDRGMLEWRARLEDVLGTRLVPGQDLVKIWSELPPARLVALAAKYHAAFILSCDAWHPDLPGATRVDQIGGWSVWHCPVPASPPTPR
jgi:hypothetical protein